MTTYIKRITMIPINTSLEYEKAIEDELLTPSLKIISLMY